MFSRSLSTPGDVTNFYLQQPGWAIAFELGVDKTVEPAGTGWIRLDPSQHKILTLGWIWVDPL